MSDAWIVSESAFLRTLLGPRPFFRDTQALYKELAGPDEARIRQGIQRVLRHVRLPHVLDVDFRWDATFEQHVAGLANLGRSQIRLPMSLLGHSERCAAALSHEVAHHVLGMYGAVHARVVSRRGQTPAALQELERLTDLTTFMLGLGPLLMSGVYWQEEAGRMTRAGYLDDAELRQALIEYAQQERLTGSELEAQLSPNGRRLMLGQPPVG
jgi:hypothetical protein